MRLRPQPLAFDPDNPFAHDLLDRKPIAESLTELVRSSPDGLVVALNAPWGAGKSTFLEMWRQHASNCGLHVLHFNAWETDFYDDALAALIGELEAGLSQLQLQTGKAESASAIVPSMSKVKAVGAKLLRRTLPVALKVATAGALDLDELTEEALAEFNQKLAEEKIKAYDDARRSIAGFREAIAAAAAATSAANQDGIRLPLVLVIDELDRCRPSYAIRLLECVKHFFAVHGLVFVIAVDRVQLGHTIRTQYGSSMDSDGYLRRFFDLELSLPTPGVTALCKAQFSRFGLKETFARRGGAGRNRSDLENLSEVFPLLFASLECTPRDIERCFGLLAMAMRSTPDNMLLIPFVLAPLIVVRIKKPDLFASIATRTLPASSILKEIGRGPKGSDFLGTRLGEVLEALILVADCDRHDLSPLIEKLTVQAQSGTDEATKRRAASILEVVRHYEARESIGTLGYLLRKIDFVASN